MVTLLTTWISQRILTITAVSVLTVAAVPTTLVITSHHDDNSATVAIIQPADDHAKAILVTNVKKAGDDVIARLDAAQATCSSQLTQTVSQSTVATKLQPTLANAKARLQSSVTPIVAAIRSDEDRFQHLTYVTSQDEQNELADLDLIQLIALGNSQNPGTVTITCQTLTVTITETIQITVTQQAPPTACTSKDERDDD